MASGGTQQGKKWSESDIFVTDRGPLERETQMVESLDFQCGRMRSQRQKGDLQFDGRAEEGVTEETVIGEKASNYKFDGTWPADRLILLRRSKKHTSKTY